jgi:pyruvate/2-oxoglutarate dehydrogenase complex dihydrolipoamide dehydrogenase (E3) component
MEAKNVKPTELWACLRVGYVPSKMLIATADRIAGIRDASKFGIRAEIRRNRF